MRQDFSAFGVGEFMETLFSSTSCVLVSSESDVKRSHFLTSITTAGLVYRLLVVFAAVFLIFVFDPTLGASYEVVFLVSLSEEVLPGARLVGCFLMIDSILF